MQGANFVTRPFFAALDSFKSLTFALDFPVTFLVHRSPSLNPYH